MYSDLGQKYHLSSLFFSHTASSLGLTSLKPLGKAFSTSLPITPYLPPQVSPLHQPPFLSPLSSLPFPLVKVSFCFRVQLQGNKISPSKNFLILSLKINFFFYCMTIAFLVHTQLCSHVALNYAPHFNYPSHSSISH